MLAAKPPIAQAPDDMLIVYGDTPLIRPETLTQLRAPLAGGAASQCLAFARPIRQATAGSSSTGDDLVAIREEADASASERAIDLCNGGMMAIAGKKRACHPGADRQPQSQG